LSPDVPPYNPLDKRNLAESIVRALLEKPVSTLPPQDSFEGAGLYVIYYTGDYPAYGPIAELNRNNRFQLPIYVGRAEPPGGRRGGFGLDTPKGFYLKRRLEEHAESIQQTRNLEVHHFGCRYLVADTFWIPLGEALLIQNYRPIWNKVIVGFGNHDPGGGRYNQQKSYWDVLHPGRTWAERCKPNSIDEGVLIERVRTSLA
jgi:hypothetical protein